MINFIEYSSQQIIEFIDLNFHLFAGERAVEFPVQVLEGIERDEVAVMREREGFAVAYKGERFLLSNGCREADLLFIYVAPEHEHIGVGTRLLQKVKSVVTPEVPIILVCEGPNRKLFFERGGFVVTERREEFDTYLMRYHPSKLK